MVSELFWPTSDRGSARYDRLHFVVVVHGPHWYGWGVTTLCGRAGRSNENGMFEPRETGFTRVPGIFCSAWDESACEDCQVIVEALASEVQDL